MKTVFNDYLITENGFLFKKTKSGILKQIKPYSHKSQHNIYLRCTLFVDKKRIRKFVHELVALGYIGKKPQGLVVNHKDGNTFNNSPENLEYCTIAQNNKHAKLLKRNK
jgi:hypothetical protein